MFGYLVKFGGLIMKLHRKILVLSIVVLFSVASFASYRPVTTEQVAQVTMSACGLANNIQALESADIYVLGNEKIAKELKKYEGCVVGDVVIRSIKSGNTIPKVKPTVVVCGSKDYVYMAKYYCRKHNILSIGASPELCKEGLSLSMYRSGDDKDGKSLTKVRLLLNLEASLNESVHWKKSISTVSEKFLSNES